MEMPDLQKYSRTFNLIKNVEESGVFLTRSVYFCEFLHCFLQTRETANKNEQFKETKTLISNCINQA